jgi:hypothetical protein
MEERRCSNCLSADLVEGYQTDTVFKPRDQDIFTHAGGALGRVLSGRLGQIATACRNCGHIDLWVDWDFDGV